MPWSGKRHLRGTVDTVTGPALAGTDRTIPFDSQGMLPYTLSLGWDPVSIKRAFVVRTVSSDEGGWFSRDRLEIARRGRRTRAITTPPANPREGGRVHGGCCTRLI